MDEVDRGRKPRPIKRNNILFLDEAGFNLHTSTNYGYFPVNKDAVLYQPASRGRNLSLCAIISKNGIKNYQIKEGAFNKEFFVSFLKKCLDVRSLIKGIIL